MITGKCPSCEKLVTQALFESINVTSGIFETDGWKGVSFLCPYCHTVLGVGIDPVALKTDTVSEISGLLGTMGTHLESLLAQIRAALNRRG